MSEVCILKCLLVIALKVISTLPTGKSQTSSLFKELTAEMALKEGTVINEALEFQLFKRERTQLHCLLLLVSENSRSF